MDELQHKCGIFGVYGKGLDAARLTYFGLYALQHRGQESSGISASDLKVIRTYKNAGLVPQVYTEDILKTLKGYIAIGHNRYSTSGGSTSDHDQPVAAKNDIVALAHNGNLPDVTRLKKFLSEQRIPTKGLNDSELMHAAIKHYVGKKYSLEDAVRKCFPLFTGAFCLLVLTKDKLIAVRDSFGIRPLALAKLNGGYVIASETCAIDTVSGKFMRDVKPGEMIVISEKGLRSYTLEKPNQKLDIFEFVYFSRPDSMLLGKNVYNVRKNFGTMLAQENPLQVDIVLPIPESAVAAAIGFAQALHIPFEFGLVKNRYIGRTFIMPDQRLRDRGVQLKLNPIREIINGKKIAVIDDSIVRGTTSKKLVSMLRFAGAKEVHLLSSCPPVMYPDFYGIDTPKQKELIGARMPISKIKKYIGADSLSYLSYKGLIQATGLSEDVFCTSCFTGNYPIDIGNNIKHIKKINFFSSK